MSHALFGGQVSITHAGFGKGLVVWVLVVTFKSYKLIDS